MFCKWCNVIILSVAQPELAELSMHTLSVFVVVVRRIVTNRKKGGRECIIHQHPLAANIQTPSSTIPSDDNKTLCYIYRISHHPIYIYIYIYAQKYINM